jgi:hypothetical protein
MLPAMNRLVAALVGFAVVLAGCGATTTGTTHITDSAQVTASAVPILTGPNPFNGKGFGSVKPGIIFQGGDPTGLVCRIHWLSWGGAFAVGTGIGWYINSYESVAEGHAAPAVVVLYRLGRWKGRSAYKAWTWYYPGNGSGFGHIPRCSVGQ